MADAAAKRPIDATAAAPAGPSKARRVGATAAEAKAVSHYEVQPPRRPDAATGALDRAAFTRRVETQALRVRAKECQNLMRTMAS